MVMNITTVLTANDLVEVESFLSDGLETVLDRFHITSLIELKRTSTLFLVARTDGDIVAVAAFGPCPRHALSSNPYQYYDTIWLRLLHHSGHVEEGDLTCLYQYVFASITHLTRIAYAHRVISPPVDLKYFKQATASSNVDIYIAERVDLVGKYAVRIACVEDFDDLEPIFSEQSEVLQETHGPFFLAELIEAQNENNAALVLTKDNQAKGMMCVTTDIRSEVLQEFFNIEATFSDLSASNAICITVTCLDRDSEPLANRALLDAMFSLYPERLYALLTLPHAAEPIALLRDFMMIPARAEIECDHVLYICHRATVQPPPTVRLGSSIDHSRIQHYLENIQAPLSNIVFFMVEDECVGMLAIDSLPTNDVLEYDSKFDIDGFISCGNVGKIVNYDLELPYRSWRREMVSEALVQLNVAIAIYPAISDPIFDLLDVTLEASQRQSTSETLLVMMQSIIGLGYTRAIVNSRIVIIGASTAAAGFLSELFRNLPSVVFTQIKQISTTALPSVINAPLRYQYICGEITYVDYAKKTVRLIANDASSNPNSYEVAYDYLVVATGLETADWLDKYGVHVPGVFSAVHKPGLHPWSAAFRFLSGNSIASESIVVNGDSVESLALLAEFEKRNFDMSKICWIYPGNLHEWARGDADVVNRINQTLGELGVEVISDHFVSYHPSPTVLLQQVNVKGTGGSARLQPTENGTFTMTCFALLSTADKVIAPTMRKALSHDPVAVDRGIIVDRFFRTNDRFVYAAGSVVQFRKIDGGSTIDLSLVNASEAGALTARSLIPVAVPCLPLPNEENAPPLIFSQPCTRFVSVPGDSNVLFVSYLPFRKATRDLQTNSMQRLVKIGIDHLNCVISITLCGCSIPGRDLMHLERFVGLPISFMNNIDQRMSQDEIADLAEYLLDDWSAPIRHDRFQNLLLKGRSLVQRRVKNILKQQIFDIAKGNDVDFSSVEGSATKDITRDINKILISFIYDNERNLGRFLYR